MKSIIQILLVLLIFTSCEVNTEKTLKNDFYSYDFNAYKSKNQLEMVNLDHFENFHALRKRMQEVSCSSKISGLEFKYNNTNYHIVGYADCPDMGIGCYLNSNLLIIKNDSIINDFTNFRNNKPIENLKSEIDSLITKDYNYQYEKNILKPAIIYLYIDEKHTISKTKKVLKEIAEQFKSINSIKGADYLRYSILFEDDYFLNAPPPPPPPLTED